MYLFLVDYNYVSSENLQRMIDQVLPEEDIVNCFSPATLLKISEKLKPELVIIDFDMVKEGKVDLIETLREKCPETYILALIDPGYYEQLYHAIERSLVDDYIAKPVSDDEFAARILITTRRKRYNKPPGSYEPEITFGHKSSGTSPSLFEESKETRNNDADFFSPCPGEDYYSKSAAENFEDTGRGEPEPELTDQAGFDPGMLGHTGTPYKDTPTDDLFSERFSLLDKDEPVYSFDRKAALESQQGEKLPGEDYFNDIFLEDNNLEEKFEKTPEQTSIPAVPPIFDEFDDIPERPERDVNISIKDYMPGESADQYLREKETETAASLNEDLLNRFLGDAEEDDLEEDYEEDDEPSGASRFISAIMNIVLALLLLMMASLSFFLIHNRVAEGPPSVGGFTFYVMQDDDLRTDANPGSLAVARSADITSISLGDIISYNSPGSSNAIETQRVVEIKREEGLKFLTSSDGAGAEQTTLVPAEEVVGKVLVSIPYYGKMVDYVQTSQGLILLIFVPGVVIIVYQLIKIFRHLSAGRKLGRRSSYR